MVRTADRQRNKGGRPSKLTPELQEEILTSIREDGCTYADACLQAGISESTFHLWKKKGAEQKRGRFSEFSEELKAAEAGFRAVRLKRLVDAAEQSKVKTKKTVRSMGDGDDAKIFQEVVEETVLPDPRWDAWLLERKYPEMFSRKHVERVGHFRVRRFASPPRRVPSARNRLKSLPAKEPGRIGEAVVVSKRERGPASLRRVRPRTPLPSSGSGSVRDSGVVPQRLTEKSVTY